MAILTDEVARDLEQKKERASQMLIRQVGQQVGGGSRRDPERGAGAQMRQAYEEASGRAEGDGKSLPGQRGADKALPAGKAAGGRVDTDLDSQLSKATAATERNNAAARETAGRATPGRDTHSDRLS